MDVDDDFLFGSGMGFLSSNEPMNWNSGCNDSSKDLKKPNYSKHDTVF